MAEIRDSENLQWVEGRCLSYSGTMAYGLWQSIIRALLKISEDTPPAISRYALANPMRNLEAANFDIYYACLSKLLGIPLNAESENLMTHMDAENVKNTTFVAIEWFLKTSAQQSPLIIVCEDLHWADPTSLALLKRVLYLTEHSPLLFICVFRPERTHGCWQIRETAQRVYPHRHIDITLAPLTTTDSEKLFINLLLSLPGPDERQTVIGLPESLKPQILERGEGNPFFVEEILRTLIRSGVIICDIVTCQWQTPREVESVSIPESLYAVLRSRIDQLPKNTRSILELASVIGRIFSYTLLADIAEKQSLDEHLVILLREQMIRERTRLPEAEYIFQHQLTLEAVYGGLLHRVRRVLHRRVAEAIERLYPDRIEEQLGLLAYHWEQAGDTIQAINYLRRAGVKAAAQYANDEAVDYLSRALDLLPSTDMHGRFELLLTRERTYNLLGDREVQMRDLDALQKLADQL
ncbi:MAG: hypothetical protein E4H27_01475 [Anaerolineales bacterium]|nr:MAG: hypothetical protein E4H27_01475 [Anaerolineales bacterium]